MSELKNSNFLVALLKRARAVMIENHGKVLSAEYVVIAALGYCTKEQGSKWAVSLTSEMDAECQRMMEVLTKQFPDPKQTMDRLLYMLADGRGQSNRYMDGIALQKLLFAAGEQAAKEQLKAVPADILIRCILQDPAQRIMSFLTGDMEGMPLAGAPGQQTADQPSAVGATQNPGEEPYKSVTVSGSKAEGKDKGKLEQVLARVKKIQATLLGSVYGQDHAVNTFTSGYFQSELTALTDPGRRKPGAAFLFAGPPGVGKTYLAERAAEALELPFKRFDMSEYCDKEANLEFAGTDKVYKGAKAGLVTEFVAAFPKCVLLFDEIEKAHLTVIHLFLQILDAGRLRDNFTDKEVSFSNAILIFTTNAGRQLYEEAEMGDFSGVARKTVLRALEKDINPQTQRPYFPAAICSRFASGNVVMFNRMEAHDLRQVARREIVTHAQQVQQSLGIDFEFDEGIFSAVLFGEGGMADARTIKARSQAFFDWELFELMAMMDSRSGQSGPGRLRKVVFGLNLPEDQPQIRALFYPVEKPEVLVFGDPEMLAGQAPVTACTLHFAQTLEEAIHLLKKRDIKLAICDIWFGRTEDLIFLNVEDVASQGRDFFRYLRENQMGLPVYLLESEEHRFHAEERLSLMREGARGVIQLEQTQLSNLCDALHQQQSMLDLAKANKVLQYETAQWVSPDGREAQIRLLDFKLSIAVDAADAEDVVSSVSKPDVRFDQVIGARDAKEELEYFVNYLKDPKKYINTGVRPPRGVLLYGPPGTGKTMLAKAMARESDAAFIAAEGNQFLKKYVGEGSEAVHALFRKARKYAPAILFIDEIDAIAKERRGGENSGSENTLTAFLAEMDGFKSDPTKPVFVLAATNFNVEPGGDKSLDPALMRRFDRRVYIDLPNRDDREEYLRRRMAANPAILLSPDKITNIAIRSTGMSLASLESVIELALRSAIRAGSDKVTDQIFDEAFETFNSGEEKTWDPRELLNTARHEAGHAFVCWHGGEVPSYVTIVARADHGGYMRHGDNEKKGAYTRGELLARIRCSLAGRAAEIVYYGPEDGLSTGAASDLRNATSIATRMLCSYGMDQEFGLATVGEKAREAGEVSVEVRRMVNKMLAAQMEQTVAILGQNRRAVDALVRALMQKNHLSGPEIDQICRENT